MPTAEACDVARARAHVRAVAASSPALATAAAGRGATPLPPSGAVHAADEMIAVNGKQASTNGEKQIVQPATRLAASLPHALVQPDGIAAMLKGKTLAFFLDYDGTLSPIVMNPEEAVITEECREILRQLNFQYAVSIVSGRSCEKLRNFIGFEMDFAGSHGLEIRSPGGRQMVHPVGETVQHALKSAREDLDSKLSHLPGYLTEDNSFCLSAHYRCVPEEHHEQVAETVKDVLSKQSLLRHKPGKMVHELRPDVDWDKGKAVEWLLDERIKDAGGDVFPIYIGDDVADEDAFTFVARVGGLGIKVFNPAVCDPTSTTATYRLDHPAQVATFLRSFVKS